MSNNLRRTPRYRLVRMASDWNVWKRIKSFLDEGSKLRKMHPRKAAKCLSSVKLRQYLTMAGVQ